MRKFFCILLICAIAAFLTACGTVSELADYPLKVAFVNADAAMSFHFDAKLKVTVDGRTLNQNSLENQYIFDIANNSYLNVSADVSFYDRNRQSGAVSGSVSYAFSDNSDEHDDANKYAANFYIAFDFGDLLTKRDSMSLVFSVYPTKEPRGLWNYLRILYSSFDNNKYFYTDLSNNEVIKDYVKKYLAGTAPNWQTMLQTLTWQRLNNTTYNVYLSSNDVRQNLNLALSSSAFSLPAEWQRRYNSFMNAISFNYALVKDTVADGQFVTQEYSMPFNLDNYKLMNDLLGRSHGRDVQIPLIATLTVNYRDWNRIDARYPTYDASNSLPLSTIPWKDIFVRFNEPIAQLTDAEERYVITVNDKKINFLTKLPPIVFNDRLLLPLRYFMETQGCLVTGGTNAFGVQTITTIVGPRTIVATQDSNIVNIGGQQVMLDGNVGVAYDVFYAPIQMFAEAFQWAAVTDVVEQPDGTNRIYVTFTDK